MLDLYCSAGGAAVGYHRAGFDVVGVDIEPQRHYPFEFHQGDALTFSLEGFDFIHASPPCQFHSAIRSLAMRSARKPLNYVDLIPPTRDRLVAWGGPFVIENVPSGTTTLRRDFQLCGSSFGLPLRRHRWFESNIAVLVPPCAHNALPKNIPIPVGNPRHHRYRRDWDGMRVNKWSRYVGVYGSTHRAGEDRDRKRAMGIDWMNRAELTQAIPPDYTELIGLQIIRALS